MDIKKGDRLEYDGVLCEVLWTHKPQGKAPTEVLLAEVVDTLDDDDEPTGRFTYGERYRVTADDLAAELRGEAPEADEADEPVAAEGHWAGDLSAAAIGSLVDGGIGRAEALELGEAGLVKLTGIGKATATKILEAAGA